MFIIENLIPFIAFIISYSFGTYLFLREPNLAINRLFIVIILSPFVKDLAELIYWRNITSFEYAAADISLWLLPPLYVHFLEIFEGKTIPWKKFFAIYSPPAIFAYIYICYEAHYTPYIFVGISFAMLLFKFAAAFAKNRDDIKYYQKLQYIFIYSGFAANLALISFIDFSDQAGYEKLKLLSPLIVVSFIASALLKLRIANILYILKKSTIYAVFLFIFVFSYIASTVYLFNYFQIINNIYAIYYLALFFILFAIIFRPIVDFIRNFIDAHIFKTAFNYKLIVENFSRKISSLVQFGEIINLIAETFAETFKLNTMMFYSRFHEPHQIETLYGEKYLVPPRCVEEITSFFKKIYPESLNVTGFEPIFVNYHGGLKYTPEIADFFSKTKICLIFPVHHENIIMGFYFLGYKYMKDDYNDDDIQLITTILNQAKVAFSNAKFYNNLISSNKMLERTVCELKNTQQELAFKEKLAALGHLAANVAHEVKNPLGIMKVAAATLENALSEKPKLKDMASFINKEIDKLNNFVSELLDFTRDRELKLAPIKAAELLGETLQKARLYAQSEKKDVECRITVEPGPAEAVEIEADYDQLTRAFINIAFNGIDSMLPETHGILTITIKALNDACLCVSFEDNGCGIGEAQLKKGIQPFYTTKKQGTGLGLAVARQIIEKHGGTIEIDSKINCGTKVAIKLPVKGA